MKPIRVRAKSIDADAWNPADILRRIGHEHVPHEARSPAGAAVRRRARRLEHDGSLTITLRVVDAGS